MKQQIIQAAYALFSEQRYHLSMSELKSAVGIKPLSINSHFSGKDQIPELMIQKEIRQYFITLITQCLRQNTSAARMP